MYIQSPLQSPPKIFSSISANFHLPNQQTHQRWTNVETTLIVDVYQRFFNVDIWLKMKVEPTYIYRHCFNVDKTTLKEHDRFTLIQRRWPSVVSRLIVSWKWKLSQRMFIGIALTLRKQHLNFKCCTKFQQKMAKNKTKLSFQVKTHIYYFYIRT